MVVLKANLAFFLTCGMNWKLERMVWKSETTAKAVAAVSACPSSA
jgi:hypothetical protein